MPFNHTGLARTLADLPNGQLCILDRLDLPEDIGRRLMELGFLPGSEIVPARTAPGGGPRVYRVDGSEVALRRETAEHLYIRSDPFAAERALDEAPSEGETSAPESLIFEPQTKP